MIKWIISASLMFSVLSVKAEEDMDGAIKNTQKVLTNKSEREKITQKDSNAKSVSEQVKNLSGGDTATEEETYAIAAEILPVIQKEAGNDPNKLMQLMAEAQANPQKFIDKLPKAQQDKIKALAAKVEKNKNKKP